MNESIKLFIVNCGGCNSKQVWESSMKYRPCDECNSTVVLKTASPDDLKTVKAQVGTSPIRFSNYLVYSLGVEDVEVAVNLKRERVKQLKTDVEDRKKFAQMERMNFTLNGNGKKKNDRQNFGPMANGAGDNGFNGTNGSRKTATNGIRQNFSSKLGRKAKKPVISKSKRKKR